MEFDPNAAAREGSGVFGLPHTRERSSVVLIPAPFDATASYGHGTARGPAAIRRASVQVDLYDRRLGRVYERGIFMEEPSPTISLLSSQTRRIAEPLIAKGGAGEEDGEAVSRIDAAGEAVNAHIHGRVSAALAEGKTPGVIGGEHSVSFGAIRACAESAGELGVLQIDAHMDLREAYGGFAWSHASVMHNVVVRVPGVVRVVQVGVRDFGEGEMDFGIEQGARVVTHYDDQWAQEVLGGTAFAELCGRAVSALPRNVYVTFDIDGLDPSLCPHTGTPVPGGLGFHQASLLLLALKESGRRVVGFDLVEVGADEWDANVGARLLYKLCGTQ